MGPTIDSYCCNTPLVKGGREGGLGNETSNIGEERGEDDGRVNGDGDGGGYILVVVR